MSCEIASQGNLKDYKIQIPGWKDTGFFKLSYVIWGDWRAKWFYHCTMYTCTEASHCTWQIYINIVGCQSGTKNKLNQCKAISVLITF